MARPPLSRQIRQLEAGLGVRLFRRDRRGVDLTEHGRALLPLARSALAEVDRAVAIVRHLSGGEPAPLRVGYGWSAAFEVLPALGQAVRERHPGVPFLAQRMWNAQLVSTVLADDLDVAVALNPDLLPGPLYETLQDETLVAIVARHHPCAGQRDVPLSVFARELATRTGWLAVGAAPG